MQASSSEIRIADLMTRSVFTLLPTQSLPLAEAMMGLRHVRHVPVVDDGGHLLGLVTHRDLLAAKLSALTPLSADERSTIELAVPVSRLMRTAVWTVAPDALAIAAARIMREHRIGCLPVVDGGRLVGIVTETDLLALVTDSLALARPAPPWTMDRVMTRVPVTITPETTISEARATMRRYEIHHLPVLEGGRPVCMVSDRDLGIAEAIFGQAKGTPAVHVVRLLGGDAPYKVALDAAFDDVLHEMFRRPIDAALVIDGEERLAGIFTALDGCRILASERHQR